MSRRRNIFFMVIVTLKCDNKSVRTTEKRDVDVDVKKRVALLPKIIWKSSVCVCRQKKIFCSSYILLLAQPEARSKSIFAPLPNFIFVFANINFPIPSLETSFVKVAKEKHKPCV